MTVTYFAYGSNMARDVIARLSPHHRFLGVACLADHRLAFTRRSVKTGSGVADIVQAPGQTVWGVLYEITDDELAAIDRKEGHGWAYTRITLPVRLEADGSERSAVTYTVRSKMSTELPPSKQYLGRIIVAARDRGLPDQYINQIEAIQTAANSRLAPRLRVRRTPLRQPRESPPP
jgi:gamma-glutamylcyclotransferase